MRPFRAFRGQPPYAGYLMVLSMLDVLEGRLAHAARQLGDHARLDARHAQQVGLGRPARDAQAGAHLLVHKVEQPVQERVERLQPWVARPVTVCSAACNRM